jgi:type IV fimbrial biogenesis protein FimT
MSKLLFSRGFTMIELMVTISIGALLVTFGVPMMSNLIEGNTISGHVNNFVGTINLARSEALKRGVQVVVCRSDNPDADLPTCAASGTGWQSGWIAFADRNGNEQMDTASSGDVLLRVQGAMTDTGGIVQDNFSKLTFRPTGLMKAGASIFTFNSRSQNSARLRRVCTKLSGRTQLMDNSTETCD